MCVEAEVETTLHRHHTLQQLEIMHSYVARSKLRQGILLVPTSQVRIARFLVESMFGDSRIKVANG